MIRFFIYHIRETIPNGWDMNRVERSIHYKKIWGEQRKSVLRMHGWIGKAKGYGDAEEVKTYPGYFFIPNSLGFYVVSPAGELLDLRDGGIVEPHLNRKGYYFWHTYLDDAVRVVRIHRLVALTFIPIPDKHRDKNLRELQVNHLDGVKTNNAAINLEWVTNAENMKHARTNGLFSTERAVLRKDADTGEVFRYQSLAATARALDTTIGGLKPYLKEPLVGRVNIDGFFYKLDDGHEWPREVYELFESKPLVNKCHTIGVHESGKRVLFMSMPNAAKYLGVTHPVLANHKSRNPPGTPYMGWVFTRLADLYPGE